MEELFYVGVVHNAILRGPTLMRILSNRYDSLYFRRCLRQIRMRHKVPSIPSYSKSSRPKLAFILACLGTLAFAPRTLQAQQDTTAQRQEYLYAPDPAIGDTLDQTERLKYHLFPRYEGFRWAIFSLNDDNTLNAYIWTEREGVSQLVVIRHYAQLSDFRDQIALYDDEDDDRTDEPVRVGAALEGGTYLVAFPFMAFGGPTCEIPMSRTLMLRVTAMAGGIYDGRTSVLESSPYGGLLAQADVRFKRTRRSSWYGFAGLSWIKPFKNEIETMDREILRTQHWWDIFHLTGGTGYLFGNVQIELTARAAWFPNLWDPTGQRRQDYVTLSASVRYLLP
jgi:hypothetical protein